MKASPRSTTNVPTMAQAIATRQPAISARSMNSLSAKGSISGPRPALSRASGAPVARPSSIARAMPRIIVK